MLLPQLFANFLAEAKLALVVSPKRVAIPGIVYCNRKMLASHNIHNIFPVEFLDFSRGKLIFFMPQSQLSVVIQTPGEILKLIVILGFLGDFLLLYKGVVPGRENINHKLRPKGLNLQALLKFSSRSRHSSQHVGVWVSPGVDFVLRKNQSVVVPTEYFMYFFICKKVFTLLDRGFNWLCYVSAGCVSIHASHVNHAVGRVAGDWVGVPGANCVNWNGDIDQAWNSFMIVCWPT